jgi:hypothetical protein
MQKSMDQSTWLSFEYFLFAPLIAWRGVLLSAPVGPRPPPPADWGGGEGGSSGVLGPPSARILTRVPRRSLRAGPTYSAQSGPSSGRRPRPTSHQPRPKGTALLLVDHFSDPPGDHGVSGTAAAMAPAAPPLIMKMDSSARLNGPQPVDRTRDLPESPGGNHFQESTRACRNERNFDVESITYKPSLVCKSLILRAPKSISDRLV